MAETNETDEHTSSAQVIARQRSQQTGSALVAPVHNQETRCKNLNSGGILRLPDEILGEISFHFRLLHLTPHPFHSFLPESYSWLVVTHICHRWREAALATPRMWAAIKITENTECARAMLERSGRVPLVVFEDTSYLRNRTLSSKKLILEEMRRIRKLRVAVGVNTLDALSKLNATDAPVLHTLDIDYNDRHSDAPFDSIPEFSSWTLPSLTRLAFRQCPSSNGKPQLSIIRPILRPTLTQLEIDSLEVPISVDVCLGLLRTLPKLEKLALNDVLSSVKDVPDHTQPPAARRIVSLPCLREISVDIAGLSVGSDDGDEAFDEGVAAADLLRCLATPASTSICFEAEHNGLTRDALNFIFCVLRDKVNEELGNLSLPFLNCTVNLFPCGRFNTDVAFLVQLNSKLQPVVATQGHTTSQTPSDQGRTLRIMVRLRCADMDTGLAFFTYGFPLTDILTLHWDGISDSLEKNYWPVVLRAVPALQELAVKGSAPSFLHAVDQALALPASESSADAVKASPSATSTTASSVLQDLKTLKIQLRVMYAAAHGRLVRKARPGRGPRNPSGLYVKHDEWPEWRNDEITGLLTQTLAKWAARDLAVDGSAKALKSLILEPPTLFRKENVAQIESAGVAASVIVCAPLNRVYSSDSD